MRIKSLLQYFATLLLPLIAFTSCIDELEYPDGDIPEGEGDITATISLRDIFSTQLGDSRSSGEAIETIENLLVAIYDLDGTPVGDPIYLTPSQWTPGTNEDMPGDVQDKIDAAGSKLDQAQPSTPTATFKIPNIPFGRYRIYVAANVGNLPTLTDPATGEKYDISTPEKFKSVKYTWKPDPKDNNQMFGYFTYDTNNDRSSEGFDAPILTIRKQNQKIHAWIKRLASKVTVAFNGSGLKQNIFVYIHNVSIRQIPLSCRLGVENKPGKREVTDAYLGQSLPESERNQVLYYSSDGFADAPTEYDTDNYEDWLMVAKGTKTDTLGCNHNYKSRALYFYENVQGDFKNDPNKKWYYKHQDPDSVGTGIGTGYDEKGMKDYRDNVPYGTFIEVEAYYMSKTAPVSYGAIRYRFMLGQDTEYNYDATRNHHYKVTLGFNGYANQPDWHIEYEQTPPAAYTPPVYIPYTYNTWVKYPVTFRGNLTGLRAEIIENNWGPYDESDDYEVAAAENGSTDFETRTLKFEWWRDLFINESGYNKNVNMNTATFDGTGATFTNSTSNYFYGRHPAYSYDGTPLYHLDDDGKNTEERYYVSPIWAGFLRLQEPEALEGKDLPKAIIRNLGKTGAAQYGGNDDGRPVLTQFRNYYYGKGFTPMSGDDDVVNTTDLHMREFTKEDLSFDKNTLDASRNGYKVEKTVDNDGVTTTTVTMKLWTQPKSMCAISGFSGNNPYEDYQRKAVIRYTATFDDGSKIIRDVTVLQSKRITNPKGVWRAHANPDQTKTKPDPFNVILYQRDTKSRGSFEPMISQGNWTATIKTWSPGDEDFISLAPGPNSTGGGMMIDGDTGSPVNFTINFKENIAANKAKCAIIEVRYHGETCVHNIFVRQGYAPIKVMDSGPYWSSYNVYSADGDYAVEDKVTGTFACNPLLFGAYFKRGNYRRAIAVSNISANVDVFGPLKYPGDNAFAFTGYPTPLKWSLVGGRVEKNWHWATFNINGKNYTVPTIDDFKTLLDGDFGIGVLYGDGATFTANNTTEAFGFMDHGGIDENGDGNYEKLPNQEYTSTQGMRGFICYNASNAHQIFFPVGTAGMGRRTIQGLSPATLPDNQRGTLRYSSVDKNLDKWSVAANSMRPIPMNMVNAPGSVYWVYTGVDANDGLYYTGWDMNYFDLNFNGLTNNAISISIGDTTAANGDALPIRLVTNTQ